MPNGCTSDAERDVWDEFFATFGTHYISAGSVGGYCLLTAIVRKASKLSASTTKAQLEIEYGATFKGGGSAERSGQSKEYRETSEKEMRPRGGDTTMAGRMESDPAAHAAWAETIRGNPANRDYSLREIWTLFGDKALAAAAGAAFADCCDRNSTCSVSLDGAKSYVDATSTRNLGLKGNACFEAWSYPTGPGSSAEGGTLLNKHGTYEIARTREGAIMFAFAHAGQTTWKWVTSPLKAPAGRWSHVAVSFNAAAGHGTVTVNGQSPWQAKREGALCASANKTWIGGRPAISQVFQGYLEEERVWNVARSVAKVQDGMYRRMTGAEPGLVGLWPLNHAAKDDARDRSASGNAGKLRDAG